MSGSITIKKQRKAASGDNSKSPGSAASSFTGGSSSAADFAELEDKPTLDRIKNEIQQSAAHPANELHEHIEDKDDAWDTESLLQDMLDGITEEDHINGK